mmetsp:Transcript_2716/g.3977  ORF Transcript_2716/g.3977 Transcript_2716/m.3977 type:complete len:567 (-) Transcript_2716:43-1743(-)|eukprot:CAMPEP_0194124424 /NCGR_PEP_ID=MMETSP0150-20130528/58507_1 /TAXON_ID=122233 /ORGANISM="Chaetoceros debilis, Strain MM31A-1" /LENGTH=566 /DNA_ID=CAMNT_0038818141 /DNA_START=69 /DNA_END=1769 /DNA_ORIENTATION=+
MSSKRIVRAQFRRRGLQSSISDVERLLSSSSFPLRSQRLSHKQKRQHYSACSTSRLLPDAILTDEEWRKNRNAPVSSFSTSALQSPLQQHQHHNMQRLLQNNKNSTNLILNHNRQMSSMTDLLPEIPEYAKNFSIWGGTAHIFNTLHPYGIPYWGCMSMTAIGLRTALFPLVVKGAKTAVRNTKSAPEIQFVMSLFLKDNKKLKDENAPPSHRMQLWTALWQSARGIWKLHKVNPLDVLKSPMLQLPIFYYFSVDVRKLVNGGNPELAQQLTESNFLWITDLTEPDPWHGLPIALGVMLYLTVEVSMGKHSLSGEAASTSNLARYIKDGFQGLAVLMPCITANSPAGVQIYLLTSFTFTLFQSAALRNDSFRALVGLPPKDAPPPDAVYVKEMIQYSKLEQETYGILDPKRSYNYKPYEQILNASEFKQMEEDAEQLKDQMKKIKATDGMGVYSAEHLPAYEPAPAIMIAQGFNQKWKAMAESEKNVNSSNSNKKISADSITEIAPLPGEIMDAANRGERPSAPIKLASMTADKKAQAPKETNLKQTKKKGFPGKRRKLNHNKRKR